MEKFLYYLAIFIGGSIGGYLPTLFGASWFSLWGIFGSFVGGLLGIYVVYKFLVSN